MNRYIIQKYTNVIRQIIIEKNKCPDHTDDKFISRFINLEILVLPNNDSYR